MTRDYPATKKKKDYLKPDALRATEGFAWVYGEFGRGVFAAEWITLTEDVVTVKRDGLPTVYYYPENARWREAGNPERHAGSVGDFIEWLKDNI